MPGWSAGQGLGKEGKEVMGGTLEAGVGEDRPPILRTPMARLSATGVKARDTCLTCALTPHRLGIVLAKTLSASGVANLATYKQIAKKWLHGVRTAMQIQHQHHQQLQNATPYLKSLNTTNAEAL